jgi:cell division protein FtsB
VKVFISVAATVVLYFGLSAFYGPVGLQSYQELSEYKQRLSANVEALESRSAELQAEADAYRTNAERLTVAARAIGYFEPNTGLVRIEGFSPERRSIAAGTLVQQRPAPPDRLPMIRWISLGFGVAVYLLLRFTPSMARASM